MACENQTKPLDWISKLLALWIAIAIVVGLAPGKYFPEFNSTLQINSQAKKENEK
jgi:ACR3 family arsenite efflux pump ArsB